MFHFTSSRGPRRAVATLFCSPTSIVTTTLTPMLTLGLLAVGLLAGVLPAAAGIVPVQPPSELECRSSLGGVALSWTASAGAAKYVMQRADGAGGTWTLETTKQDYFDDLAPLDEPITWRVAAVDASGASSSSVSCSAIPLAAASKPFIGPPIVDYEDRVVLTFGAPSASRTTYRLSAEVRRVPAHLAWESRLLVGVFDPDGALVREIASAPNALPSGDSELTTEIEIDVVALGLPVGSYVVRGTLLATPAGELPAGFAAAVDRISVPEEPAMSFISSADDALRVLDRGDEQIAAYWVAIESGNADTAYKATSALLNHYRDRGMYQEAEQEVAAAAMVDTLQPMAHVLRYWAVDDRRFSGDHTGAVQLLLELIDEMPASASFFGEPYEARGLLDLAGLYRRVGSWSSVFTTLQRLTVDFPGFHRPTVQMQVGESLLELGKPSQAISIFQQLIESQSTCVAENAVCPTVSQVQQAEEWVDLIQSPRDWMRPDAGELMGELEAAISGRDIERLESLVPSVGLDFALSAGEHSRTQWSTLRRFFSDALSLSPRLGFDVKPAYGPRQSAVLTGVAPEAGAGPTGAVVLTVERTPLGWQWGSVGGVLTLMGSNTDPGTGGWDPCSIDPTDASLPYCTGQEMPPISQPPGGAAARLQLEAPWAPGSHMRAGGLSADLSAGQTAEMVLDLLLDSAAPINDRCGNSVPGYLYGLGTHTNEDHYAIDFTQGFTLFCIWDACVTPPGMMVNEVANALVDTVFGLPTRTPAYNDPVHAAREGLVIEVDCQFEDGNTEDPNRVETAVWDQADPVSIARLIETTPNSSASKGTFLGETEADYWIRYLHLRKEHDCPSRGTWVEQGQVIGRMDDSGNSFTSHLHMVVRHRPAVDPEVTTNWRSARQVIHDNSIGHDDNGACIKSDNELSRSDRDGDGILDAFDNCTTVANPDQGDVDLDMIGDACDDNTCPFDATEDFDGDGIVDPCDPDLDGDGVLNELDACPYFDDAIDFDGDGTPDDCDLDADDDGFNETCEPDWALACGCLRDIAPTDPNQAGDHDGDGIDSLSDSCPCSDFNPTCSDLIDLPPPGLGGAAAAEWGEPHGPGSPYDPYGWGGSPYGPGGQYP